MVEAGPDLDGDGFSDCWIISGTTAWMNEVVDNNFHNWISDVGEVATNFLFLAFKN